MSKNLLSLSSAQLRRVIKIKEKIAALTKELNSLAGVSEPAIAHKAPRKKRRMSAAGRAKIIAAQKARWAKFKAAKK